MKFHITILTFLRKVPTRLLNENIYKLYIESATYKEITALKISLSIEISAEVQHCGVLYRSGHDVIVCRLGSKVDQDGFIVAFDATLDEDDIVGLNIKKVGYPLL